MLIIEKKIQNKNNSRLSNKIFKWKQNIQLTRSNCFITIFSLEQQQQNL